MDNTQLIEYVRRGGGQIEVGDRVRILPRHEVQNPDNSPIYTHEMTRFEGQHVTVQSISRDFGYLEFDEIGYNWSPAWVERV